MESEGPTLLLGCQGGGRADQEMEVVSVGKTATQSALKGSPDSRTLQLQRSPGPGGSLSGAVTLEKTGNSFPRPFATSPAGAATHRRLGSSLGRD